MRALPNAAVSASTIVSVRHKSAVLTISSMAAVLQLPVPWSRSLWHLVIAQIYTCGAVFFFWDQIVVDTPLELWEKHFSLSSSQHGKYLRENSHPGDQYWLTSLALGMGGLKAWTLCNLSLSFSYGRLPLGLVGARVGDRGRIPHPI